MECKKIGEIATLSQGIQVPIEKQSTINNSDSVRFLRIIDYTQNKDEVRYIDNPGEKYLVDDTDVVMIRYGDAGKVVRGYKGAIANNLFKISIPENLVIKEYLYYYLSQKCIYERLVNNQQKTGLPAVNFKTVNDIEISFPKNLETQKKIVEVLDKAQELIDKRKEQLEALDELVKSRFIEMFGDPYLNPKEWEVSYYEDICNVITDGEHSTPKRCEQGIYLLSARNVLNHSLQLNDVDFIDDSEYNRISKRIIPEENDILISCSGSVGRVCKVPKNIKFQMVRSVAILKLKKNINSTFMEWLIDSNYTQQQILKSINQSSQANLFQGKIKKLKAIVPPIELQNEFADFVKQVDKLKSQMETSLKELEDNFNSLMQKAFKGELF